MIGNGPVRPVEREMENRAVSIASEIFAEAEMRVYALLDGASVPGLQDRLFADRPEYECLYRGELAPDLAEVAPYLVLLGPNSAFTDWVIAQGWGNHWGVFALAREDLRTVRRHFRTLLTVRGENGQPVQFRYYDPRVLRVYLPTCTPEELAEFFGPVQCYVQEAEQPGRLLRYQLKEQRLVKQEISLKDWR